MQIHRFLLWIPLCLLISSGCGSRVEPTRQEISDLKEIVEIGDAPSFVSNDADGKTAWAVTKRLYASRNFRPAWFAHGQPLPQVKSLVDAIAHATDDGLDPASFAFDQTELSMTYALVRYAFQLYSGRVDPKSVDSNWHAAAKEGNLEQILAESIDNNQIDQLPARLAPPYPEYAALKEKLREYHAMNPPDDESIRKIEVNLDRLRWLPEDMGERHIRVYIPDFQLEVHDHDEIPLKMRIIVGSNENRTPIFSGSMKYVVFSPYWNIPPSIARKETLPHFMKDPAYLEKQQIEVIRVSGKTVETVDPSRVKWDDAGARSGYQLRQRPGAKNSLGLVKFMFPNPFNVYLHDTPSDNLFEKLTRNLSHGCIRLEQPDELAQYVLRDQPHWTREKINAAMHARNEMNVSLKSTLPVHILYWTAWVDANGELQLRNDVYGYDQKHQALITKNSP